MDEVERLTVALDGDRDRGREAFWGCELGLIPCDAYRALLPFVLGAERVQ